MRTKMDAPIRSSVVLAILIALGATAAIACTPQGDPSIDVEFVDNFDRSQLGPLWSRSGGNWEIKEGQLRIKGARNHPLWLRRTLPRDVEIEFDVRSESEEGDIKVEVFGDGASHAKSASYTATSYVVIFGGWGNSLNVLARMNEHGSDRVVGNKLKVVPGKTYHLKIRREGQELGVWVDGVELMKMSDKEPLWGRGHDHFAFNNWQSELWFDNLTIRPVR